MLEPGLVCDPAAMYPCRHVSTKAWHSPTTARQDPSTHAHTRICMYVYVHNHTYLCVNNPDRPVSGSLVRAFHACICVYVYVRVCMCICVCMYVCVLTCAPGTKIRHHYQQYGLQQPTGANTEGTGTPRGNDRYTLGVRVPKFFSDHPITIEPYP